MSCWRDDHRAVWQGVSAWCEVLAANTVTAGDIMAALIEFDDVFRHQRSFRHHAATIIGFIYYRTPR
jgi:hypothetical protein